MKVFGSLIAICLYSRAANLIDANRPYTVSGNPEVTVKTELIETHLLVATQQDKLLDFRSYPGPTNENGYQETHHDYEIRSVNFSNAVAVSALVIVVCLVACIA